MGANNSYAKVALVQWYNEGKAKYGAAGFKAASKHFSADDLPANVNGMVCAVTGANKGIGFESAKSLAQLGAEVHLLCRDAKRGEEAAKAIREAAGHDKVYSHVLDVSEFKSIRSFADSFTKSFQAQGKHLNVLINNAGCMPSERTLTSEGNETIMACTMGGTLLLSALMLPLFPSTSTSSSNNTYGGHIINVSSGGMYSVKGRHKESFNMEDIKPYDGTLFYAFAKRAQVECTEVMSLKLMEKKGIRVNAMHPGWSDTEALQTAMPDFHKSQSQTLRSPAEGADTVVYLAASPKVREESGKFWFDRKAVRTHMSLGGTALSVQERETLFLNGLKYVGLPPDAFDCA